MSKSEVHGEPCVCVPMNVDAFILNPPVCDKGLTRIAPITQPDYRGLRLNPAEIQHDILPHVDVTHSQPATVNSRIYGVEASTSGHVDPSFPEGDITVIPPVWQNRVGVYLHWSLPRMYRAATSASDSVKKGLPVGQQGTSTSPLFRLVPNRWLVVRRIVASTPSPPSQEEALTAWVVDSDRLWDIKEIGQGVDIETEMSPFVAYEPDDETNLHILDEQAGVFIGEKVPSTDWKERGNGVRRVPLTTMNSSNFCFADNTIHNPNVFSAIDNLRYKDKDGRQQEYERATCDYTVLGWHDNQGADPLGGKELQGSLQERLRALFCSLIDDDKSLDGWGRDYGKGMRTLCYGTILGVQFDRKRRPPIPSDKFADLFTSNAEMEPVSVGTTPLDAVLTFLQAHQAEGDDLFGAGASAVAKNILALRELLYAAGDSYNARIKAADLVYADNFGSLNGGATWHFSRKTQPGEPPAEPSTKKDPITGLSQLDYLNRVNELQIRLDAAKRKLQSLQWAIFAVWWEIVSDPASDDPDRKTAYESRVTELQDEVAAVRTVIGDSASGLIAKIDDIVHREFVWNPNVPIPIPMPRVPARSVPQPAFYQRKDPNLCIAGMEDGWPREYTGYVPVRLWRWFILYREVQERAIPVINLLPRLLPNVAQDIQSPTYRMWWSMYSVLTYIFDGRNHTAEIGFKQWKGQPWCPLYIEWEATYFHIPFNKWSVQILNSPVGNNHQQVRYGIKEPLWTDPDATEDQRELSGRIIVTPQPVVNLHALVAQVLDTANAPEPVGMNQDQLLDGISRLKFMSAELDGLTNGIVTLVDGSHVQPNLHIPGNPTPLTLAASVAAGTPFGLAEDDLALIGDEAGSTPFGTLVNFSNSMTDPFKPVTHGQFRFTKLNIVDKFGQVICAIGPTVEPRKPTGWGDTIHPCLGDQVCPGVIEFEGERHLNTVAPLTVPDPNIHGGYPMCPFVQLPPAINQPARLNAAFVEIVKDDDGNFSGWKTTNDWEQPVWGWVVVNIADYGLQFFTSEGVFYVELSLGGPTGSIGHPTWRPFNPPKNPTNVVSQQLVELIAQMTDPVDGVAYLRSFWDMITQALVNMPYAPADYAAFASSIVGKPLALVDVGISLELATAPLKSQITLPPTSPPETDPPDLLAYGFPIKIGDAERPFDGVVGYFETDNTATGQTSWTKLFTYFPSEAGTPAQPGDPRVMIEPGVFPSISPFYVDPVHLPPGSTYESNLAKEFHVKTLLIDPYTPLHVYTPILPITTLQLPAWSVQAALQKMSAFFRLGPCLLTKDVPATFDEDKAIVADEWGERQQNLVTNPESATVRLPLLTGKKGVWNWLQPYAIPTEASGTYDTQYNGFDVGEDDGRIRLDPGPYSLVEGFLQLAQPLAKRTV